MNPGGLILVMVLQLATFLAPLLLARAGFLSGEAAGLAAIVCWFVVGMPVSFAVAGKAEKWRSRRASPVTGPSRSVPAPSAVLSTR